MTRYYHKSNFEQYTSTYVNDPEFRLSELGRVILAVVGKGFVGVAGTLAKSVCITSGVGVELLLPLFTALLLATVDDGTVLSVTLAGNLLGYEFADDVSGGVEESVVRTLVLLLGTYDEDTVCIGALDAFP